MIFAQGDEVEEVFLLARGVVKLIHASTDNEESLLGLRYEGELVGDWWAGVMSVHPVSAVAANPCELHRYRLNKIVFREPCESTAASDLHRRLLQLDLCNLAATRLEPKVSSATRLELRLRELAAVPGRADSAGEVRLVMPLTSAEVASLCGLSESHYKALRHRLEADGRLRRRGRSWILPRPLP